MKTLKRFTDIPVSDADYFSWLQELNSFIEKSNCTKQEVLYAYEKILIGSDLDEFWDKLSQNSNDNLNTNSEVYYQVKYAMEELDTPLWLIPEFISSKFPTYPEETINISEKSQVFSPKGIYLIKQFIWKNKDKLKISSIMLDKKLSKREEILYLNKDMSVEFIYTEIKNLISLLKKKKSEQNIVLVEIS